MPDFARSIVEYFVERRGKESAVSGADQHVIGNWEARDIPLEVVFEGIDGAFDRRKEPPKSLTDCGRFVTNAFKRWSRGAEEEADGTSADPVSVPATTPPGADPAARRPTSDTGATTTAPTLAEGVLAALGRTASEHAHDAVRSAAAKTREELEEIIATDGELDAAILALVDDAVARWVLAGLDPESRRAVEAQVARVLVDHGHASGSRDSAWDRALREHLAERFAIPSMLGD